MISEERVREIGEYLSRREVLEDAIGGLRDAYPDIHFTFCMDDDVVAVDPKFENNAFNLYLVGGAGHCLAFTHDYDMATGLVLAEIEQ